MIAADENFSPETMAKGFKAAGLPYVQLKQSSDLIYLQWQKKCSDAGQPVGGLRYFFRINVVNTKTGSIINQAQASSGFPRGDFAHRTIFYPGSAAYYALLGTPNASGVALLLIQHKAQLSIKTISSIAIFEFLDPDGDPVPALLLTIAAFSPPS